MNKLPQEIIDMIATSCEPYESLVLGRMPDSTQLYLYGGAGVLLTEILTRGGDIRLLLWMKSMYFPKIDIPLYKAVQSQYDKLVTRVSCMWDQQPSYDTIKYINKLYISQGKIDKLDPSYLYDMTPDEIKVCYPMWKEYMDKWQIATYKATLGITSDDIDVVSTLSKHGYKDKALELHLRIDHDDPTECSELCTAVVTRDHTTVNRYNRDHKDEMWNYIDKNSDMYNAISQGGLDFRGMTEDGEWDMPDPTIMYIPEFRSKIDTFEEHMVVFISDDCALDDKRWFLRYILNNKDKYKIINDASISHLYYDKLYIPMDKTDDISLAIREYLGYEHGPLFGLETKWELEKNLEWDGMGSGSWEHEVNLNP